MNHQDAPSIASTTTLYHVSEDTRSSDITKPSKFSRFKLIAKKQQAHQEETSQLVPSTSNEPTEAQLLAKHQKEKENLIKHHQMSEEEAERFLSGKAKVDKQVEERNMQAFGPTIASGRSV